MNASARIAFWRSQVSWADVPFPLMSFLQAKFGNTNWRYVFLQGSLNHEHAVKEIYYSRTVCISRKAREISQEVPSASSTTVSEVAADMHDGITATVNSTPDADSKCYYADSFHHSGAAKPAFAVRMKSKATPRWRHVCIDCCHWMQADSLLDQYKELA